MSQKTVTERLKDIQRHLDVSPDGILGPVTLSAIEGALGFIEAVEFNLIVSRNSLDLIVRFEISSFANYERALARPTWPGGESGVTIGIGYDLGFTSEGRIEADWKGEIPDDTLTRLLATAGVNGTAARDLIPGLSDLVIPLEAARQVFTARTLPHHANETRKAFPGVEALPADAQGMLLSLVFNRGPSMADKPSRREMRAIRPLVVGGDLAGIAEQIRSMKRLWDPNVLPGLHARRDKEAEVVGGANRDYDPSELVKV